MVTDLFMPCGDEAGRFEVYFAVEYCSVFECWEYEGGVFVSIVGPFLDFAESFNFPAGDDSEVKFVGDW